MNITGTGRTGQRDSYYNFYMYLSREDFMQQSSCPVRVVRERRPLVFACEAEGGG
jgi:hypothetical protein